jgi:phage terminase large subunit-like protein
VRAGWTDTFISECEEFPDGPNDDQIDAASGAFAVLEGDGGWGQFTSVTGGQRRI